MILAGRSPRPLSLPLFSLHCFPPLPVFPGSAPVSDTKRRTSSALVTCSPAPEYSRLWQYYQPFPPQGM